jgi:chlorite dismutase
MHLFFRVDRVRWSQLSAAEVGRARERFAAVVAANSDPSHPRIATYANLGGKCDFVFMLLAADFVQLGQMQRELETAFPPGTLVRVYSYLSVTELTEYQPTAEDVKQRLIHAEKLSPESPEFATRLAAEVAKMDEYSHYRLYPELPDWEVMCFYPMNKRRSGGDNWYMLDLATRKKLMGGHARVGRKYAGRVTQLISGSTGLDDWEWGVTLVAHQLDALKEIVYEMRFDEVSARYGEFGEFYTNLRLEPAALMDYLKL